MRYVPFFKLPTSEVCPYELHEISHAQNFPRYAEFTYSFKRIFILIAMLPYAISSRIWLRLKCGQYFGSYLYRVELYLSPFNWLHFPQNQCSRSRCFEAYCDRAVPLPYVQLIICTWRTFLFSFFCYSFCTYSSVRKIKVKLSLSITKH